MTSCQTVLDRLPKSTFEYVVALLTCKNHRSTKNAITARNTIVAIGNCSLEIAEEVCEKIKWSHYWDESLTSQLREKWAPAFHDINTRYVPVRSSHAPRHRFF